MKLLSRVYEFTNGHKAEISDEVAEHINMLDVRSITETMIVTREEFERIYPPTIETILVTRRTLPQSTTKP